MQRLGILFNSKTVDQYIPKVIYSLIIKLPFLIS